MGKQELSLVLKTLPKLSAEELAQVQGRLGILAGISAAKVYDHGWLLVGVTEELRRRGLWMNKYPIPAKLLPEKFTLKANTLQEFLLKGFGKQKLQRAECLAIAMIATQTLADWLERGKVPLSPKTILFNLDKIPTALEHSFPGYWEHGLLGVLLRK